MIKLSDLGIGNLILWNPALLNPNSTLPPFVVDVCEIHLEKIGYVSPSIEHRVEPFEDDLIQGAPVYRSISEFEPVSLTEAVLKNAGFEKQGKYWRHNNFKVTEHENVYRFRLVDNEPEFIKIAFLHQLQNTYYLVTGDELYVHV